MAKHKVNFNVPDRPVGNVDIVFTVRQDDDKFGELRISKGGLVWYPRNSKTGYPVTWKDLDKFAKGEE
jgi:hypothetical protein